MANVAYTSRVKVERVDGKVRRAYLPAEPEPVLFGVHGEIAPTTACQQISSIRTPRRSTTWSRPRAGDC